MKLTRIVSFFFLLAAGTAQAARLADATGVDTTDLTSPGGSIVGSATHASFPTAKLFDDDVSQRSDLEPVGIGALSESEIVV